MAVKEKKKFRTVQIPLLNKEIELYGREGEYNGRSVKLNLANIMKGKSFEIVFSVKETDKEISTEPKAAYLHGSYIRRMMRKGTDYVEDSFLAQCKDHRIRIKPFLITRKRVSREVLKGLRKKAREEISEYVKDKTFGEIVSEIMNTTLQKSLIPKLKKIYPLGLSEIRYIGIEDLKEHERYELEQKAKLESEKTSEDKVEKKTVKKTTKTVKKTNKDSKEKSSEKKE